VMKKFFFKKVSNRAKRVSSRYTNKGTVYLVVKL